MPASSAGWWVRPSCRSTRSRSLIGPASPRPRLPTAASAIPSAEATVVVADSHSPPRAVTTSATMAARRAAPSDPGPLSRAATSSRDALRSRTPGAGCGTSGVSCPVTGATVHAWWIPLQGLWPVLTRADPSDVVDGDGPDLAITDLARLGRPDDRIGHPRSLFSRDQHLDPNLRNQVDRVLGTAVDLRVTPLTAVAARFAHGDAVDPGGFERRLHLVQTVWLDDSRDQLHAFTSMVAREPMVSYAVSPWIARSTPLTSTSSLVRRPIVFLIARPMRIVTTNE